MANAAYVSTNTPNIQQKKNPSPENLYRLIIVATNAFRIPKGKSFQWLQTGRILNVFHEIEWAISWFMLLCWSCMLYAVAWRASPLNCHCMSQRLQRLWLVHTCISTTHPPSAQWVYRSDIFSPFCFAIPAVKVPYIQCLSAPLPIWFALLHSPLFIVLEVSTVPFAELQDNADMPTHR